MTRSYAGLSVLFVPLMAFGALAGAIALLWSPPEPEEAEGEVRRRLAEVDRRLEQASQLGKEQAAIAKDLAKIARGVRQLSNHQAIETSVREVAYTVYKPVLETITKDGVTFKILRWVAENRLKEFKPCVNLEPVPTAAHVSTVDARGEFQCSRAEAMPTSAIQRGQVAAKYLALGERLEALKTVEKIKDDWARGHILAYHVIPYLETLEELKAALPQVLSIKKNPEAKTQALTRIALVLESLGNTEDAQKALSEAGKALRELQALFRESSLPSPLYPPSPAAPTPAPTREGADREPVASSRFDLPGPEVVLPPPEESKKSIMPPTEEKVSEAESPTEQESGLGQTIKKSYLPWYKNPWLILFGWIIGVIVAVCQPLVIEVVKVWWGRYLALNWLGNDLLVALGLRDPRRLPTVPSKPSSPQ